MAYLKDIKIDYIKVHGSYASNIQNNQERSIGDHFIYENLDSKMWPNETNEEMDQVSNKLNIYLW